MKVNMRLLNQKIDESGMTRDAVAKELGIDYSTFYRKMKEDGVSFSIGQAHKLSELLNLCQSDSSLIFLSEDSH